MRSIKPVLSSLVLLAALIGDSTAWAGAWTSGGGELIKDGQNPWFLQNTRSASYCIEVGPYFSEQSLDILRRGIEDAAEYWKRRLALVRPFKKARLPDGSMIETGAQIFEYEPCGRDTAIVFQFGTLNEVQRKFIGDPTRFVALTIRTDYDPVNLRGKGFVYVSPDSGPDRYAGEELVDRAWTQGDGGLLLATLIHEFGHIFGFPHIPGYAPGQLQWAGLMSEDFAERILQKYSYDVFQTRRTDFPFLIFDYINTKSITQCAPTTVQSPPFEFFGGDPRNGQCFEFRLTPTGMDVYQKKISRNPQKSQLGSIFLGRIDVEGGLDFSTANIPHSNYLPADLYLTKDQRVYDLDPPGSRPIYPRSVALHELVVFKLNGKYRSQDGTINRAVRCQLGAADFTVSAEFGGQIFEDIVTGY